jgi:hypothetical protein
MLGVFPHWSGFPQVDKDERSDTECSESEDETVAKDTEVKTKRQNGTKSAEHKSSLDSNANGVQTRQRKV